MISDKPTFYEQVTSVKGLFFVFSFIGLLLLLLLLVSLLSTVFLFALLMSCLHASSVPVDYNEDDCLATGVVVDGIRSLPVNP